MATDSARELRQRLSGLGLSASAIDAAWPRWWSEAADESASARTELHFSVARRLGLDPRSLIDQEQSPRFIWRDEARFKHLSGEDELELAGITSFGRAVTSALIRATPETEGSIAGLPAPELRAAILARGAPFVSLPDLVALAWGTGIPVVHLRVFPWQRKRMAAMTVRLGDHWSVLLGKEASYPPHLAFYLAHELGHIALGHVASGDQIVDLDETGAGDADQARAEERASASAEGERAEDIAERSEGDPKEEEEADAYALELLTGKPDQPVLPERAGWASASELARTAGSVAAERQIDPGMVALLYGHSTGDWQLANAAMKHIYPGPAAIWAAINSYARSQLDLEQLSSDGADFLEAILGGDEPR